ncbi:MAG: hypothetical protein J6O41_00420 [Clostridia bacterium]|nr:hypothetical protein [Clostridia bacterium]
MNNEIVFVTHNTGKIKSAEKYFKNLKFITFNYELDEPRSDDIQEIAKSKVMQAYKIVNRPCIALDTDFRIDELNGFPRAFVNFSLDTIGIDGILKLMENKDNRNCAFNECLAYHDGKKYIIFMENIQEVYHIKFKGQIEKKNGLIYGIFSSQKDLKKL